MNTLNKHIATSFFLTTLVFSSTLQGAPLREAVNFEALGQLVREQKTPLLLVFETEHCNFCQRLKAEHLQPMNNNEDYNKRILIRTIQIDGSDQITDFDGKKVSRSELSNGYKAYLTPTMLFLNDKGEEIAERMLGYNSPDYFGFYLDQAIEAAGKALRESEPQPK